MSTPRRFSIIIPMLNEQAAIVRSLQALQPLREQNHEIILVDGGSQDRSCTLARQWVDILITAHGGRGAQLRAGAKLAKGDALLFLHADTELPDNALTLLKTALAKRIWSRFHVRLSGQHWAFRIIERMINLRSCWSGIATGDQALCIRREAYFSSGGFPAIALMEDLALTAALRRRQKPACISAPVVTSSRRWEKQGIARTVVQMWILRTAYFWGVSPQRLLDWYRECR